MDKRIEAFITDYKVLTMSTSVENRPYSASCYYAYDAVNHLLIFSSDDSTKHISDALNNGAISGTINAENKTVAKIKGIQYIGDFIQPSIEEQEQFATIYYKRFPFAKAMVAPIWAIQLNWIKMTDNTLGFGKKLEWERKV